jgi:hypothetical protein
MGNSRQSVALELEGHVKLCIRRREMNADHFIGVKRIGLGGGLVDFRWQHGELDTVLGKFGAGVSVGNVDELFRRV